MGTHPIFESDFDCLTEMGNLLGKSPKKREESPAPATTAPVEQAPVPTGLPVVQEEAEQKLEAAIEQATGAAEEVAEAKVEAVTEEVAQEVEQVTQAVEKVTLEAEEEVKDE